MKKSYIFILASVALSGCASKEASEADIQALLNKYYGSYCEYLNTSNLKKISHIRRKMKMVMMNMLLKFRTS